MQQMQNAFYTAGKIYKNIYIASSSHLIPPAIPLNPGYHNFDI